MSFLPHKQVRHDIPPCFDLRTILVSTKYTEQISANIRVIRGSKRGILMDEIEQRVLDAIDMDGLLACLCDLIGVASLDGTPEEIAIQERVADAMCAIGLAVDAW